MTNTKVEMNDEMMEQVNGGWDLEDVWDWVKDTTSEALELADKLEKTFRFL